MSTGTEENDLKVAEAPAETGPTEIEAAHPGDHTESGGGVSTLGPGHAVSVGFDEHIGYNTSMNPQTYSENAAPGAAPRKNSARNESPEMDGFANLLPQTQETSLRMVDAFSDMAKTVSGEDRLAKLESLLKSISFEVGHQAVKADEKLSKVDGNTLKLPEKSATKVNGHHDFDLSVASRTTDELDDEATWADDWSSFSRSITTSTRSDGTASSLIERPSTLDRTTTTISRTMTTISTSPDERVSTSLDQNAERSELAPKCLSSPLADISEGEKTEERASRKNKTSAKARSFSPIRLLSRYETPTSAGSKDSDATISSDDMLGMSVDDVLSNSTMDCSRRGKSNSQSLTGKQNPKRPIPRSMSSGDFLEKLEESAPYASYVHNDGEKRIVELSKIVKARKNFLEKSLSLNQGDSQGSTLTFRNQGSPLRTSRSIGGNSVANRRNFEDDSDPFVSENEMSDMW